MKRKTVFAVLLLISIIILLIGVYWTDYGKYHPRQALWLPSGYINLQKAINDTNGAMSYVFFEEYVSLVDKKGGGVGGAMVRDNSFIVIYKGEYYVNAEKFNSALEEAKKIFDQDY